VSEHAKMSLIRAAVTAVVVFGFSSVSLTAALVAGFFLSVFYSPAGDK